MNKNTMIAMGLVSLVFGGFSHAGLQEGIAAYQNGDYVTARSELEPLADASDPAALYYLGEIERFQASDGKRNTKRAASLIRKSAELGYPAAMLVMGKSLRHGRLIDFPRDQKAALGWLERASGAGDPEGTLELADCLATCEDIPRDFPRAFGLMQQSVASGSVDAMYHLGTIYLGARWGRAARDIERARGLFEAAATSGHSDAMWRLGWLLASEIHPPQPEAAFAWFKRAADNGHEGARYAAGLMLLKGEGTLADESAARAMFESIERKPNQGTGPLALLRYEGRGGFEPDEKAAIEFGRGWYVGGYSDEEQKQLSNSDVLIRLARIALDKGAYFRPDLAFRIYQSLALRGDLNGKYAVGVMTLQGKGGAADEAKGKRLLAEIVRSKGHSQEAFWAAYLLAEYAYRHGQYRESARLLPDIFGKALVKAALMNDRRPWEISSNLKDIIADKKIDLSWTFALALREGGSGPVGWAVAWKMVSGVNRTCVEDRSVLPVKMEARWARLLDQTARRSPELQAFIAVNRAEMLEKCFGKNTDQEATALLSELKAARMRGSLLARLALAHLYISEGYSAVKLRTEQGITKNEKLGGKMLKELSKMGVTQYTVEGLR